TAHESADIATEIEHLLSRPVGPAQLLVEVSELGNAAADPLCFLRHSISPLGASCRSRSEHFTSTSIPRRDGLPRSRTSSPATRGLCRSPRPRRPCPRGCWAGGRRRTRRIPG